MIHNWETFNESNNEDNKSYFKKEYDEIKSLIDNAKNMSDISGDLVDRIKKFNKRSIHVGTKDDSKLGDELLKLRTKKSKEILKKY